MTAAREHWKEWLVMVLPRMRRRSCILGNFFIFMLLLTLLFINPSLLHYLFGEPLLHSVSDLSAQERQVNNVESGPLHVLVVSYARTGSSFLGELLQTLPDTFYHYGPLRFLNEHVLTGNLEEAHSLLANLFRCSVHKVDGFLQKQTINRTVMNVGYMQRSVRYWADCTRANGCFNVSYVDSYCLNQRFVIIKTNRLNLREASKLFHTHPDLNLKIIYLSRDPRGTFNSREKYPFKTWCSEDPACYDSNHFCSTLVDDLQFVCSLSASRPKDFVVLRYEDLSTDPYGVSSLLVKFLGLSSIPAEMGLFIKSHTIVTAKQTNSSKEDEVKHTFSTFRNSSITAVWWRKQMSYETLIKIQNSCKSFLAAMGYHFFTNLETLRSLTNFDSSLDNALHATCGMKYKSYLRTF